MVINIVVLKEVKSRIDEQYAIQDTVFDEIQDIVATREQEIIDEIPEGLSQIQQVTFAVRGVRCI